MIIEAPDSHVSMNHLDTLERGVCSCSKLERRKHLLCIWKNVHRPMLIFPEMCFFKFR